MLPFQMYISQKSGTYIIFYIEINPLSCVFHTVCNCMHEVFDVHKNR